MPGRPPGPWGSLRAALPAAEAGGNNAPLAFLRFGSSLGQGPRRRRVVGPRPASPARATLWFGRVRTAEAVPSTFTDVAPARDSHDFAFQSNRPETHVNRACRQNTEKIRRTENLCKSSSRSEYDCIQHIINPTETAPRNRSIAARHAATRPGEWNSDVLKDSAHESGRWGLGVHVVAINITCSGPLGDPWGDFAESAIPAGSPPPGHGHPLAGTECDCRNGRVNVAARRNGRAASPCQPRTERRYPLYFMELQFCSKGRHGACTWALRTG